MVWGGNLVGVGPQQDQLLGDGARYDPATDQWRALPIAGAPSPRQNPEVAWTGQELLVWGGLASQGAGSSVPAVPLATGSRYDPRQDAWTPMATDGGPPGAWGGAFALSRGLLVWQGVERGGAWYDAAADQWQSISPPTMLSGRADASTCVVQPADATILVWCGGLDPNHLDRTAGPAGARYRLDTHQWIALTSSGGPSPRWAPYSLWTGQEWLLWGGRKPLDRPVPNNALPSVPRDAPAESGAAYDPHADHWRPFDGPRPPANWRGPSLVWTGGSIIVWGGAEPDPAGGFQVTTSGWAYDVTTGVTRALPSPPVALGIKGRTGATLVWTGSSLLIWGGDAGLAGGPVSDGALFTPDSGA